jgi:hypothetical protein
VRRVQGYFLWTKKIVEKIGDTNPYLCEKLNKIYAGTFERDGVSYKCIDDKMTLDEYYTLLKESGEK